MVGLLYRQGSLARGLGLVGLDHGAGGDLVGGVEETTFGTMRRGPAGLARQVGDSRPA